MRILRLNNNICELVEIENTHEVIKEYVEELTITNTLLMVTNGNGRRLAYAENAPATALFRYFYKVGSVYGPAFLCSYNKDYDLVSLTDEDYEIAAKVLRSYGYVKGD